MHHIVDLGGSSSVYCSWKTFWHATRMI
jgi:hypothetical protein